eukprot:TRINITY_DN6187_c0_g1_i5.p1 TRINITY_DN6187_c0_g1~~TRINITY_DN6187_c0_g1_i5.p1  ORF type:complete len:433 (-),score=106.37 TRINITY_DN6187_c0_g1_i5:1250-2548(-)
MDCKYEATDNKNTWLPSSAFPKLIDVDDKKEDKTPKKEEPDSINRDANSNNMISVKDITADHLILPNYPIQPITIDFNDLVDQTCNDTRFESKLTSEEFEIDIIGLEDISHLINLTPENTTEPVFMDNSFEKFDDMLGNQGFETVDNAVVEDSVAPITTANIDIETPKLPDSNADVLKSTEDPFLNIVELSDLRYVQEKADSDNDSVATKDSGFSDKTCRSLDLQEPVPSLIENDLSDKLSSDDSLLSSTLTNSNPKQYFEPVPNIKSSPKLDKKEEKHVLVKTIIPKGVTPTQNFNTTDKEFVKIGTITNDGVYYVDQTKFGKTVGGRNKQKELNMIAREKTVIDVKEEKRRNEEEKRHINKLHCQTYRLKKKHAKDLLRKEYEYQVTVNQELKMILAKRKKELDELMQHYMRAISTGANIDTNILKLLES